MSVVMLSDETGRPLKGRISPFLRFDFNAPPTGDWPKNPPSLNAFLDNAAPSGTPPTRLASIVAQVASAIDGPVALGIVDLATPPDPVVGYDFAGWGLDEQATIGSAAKTWAMYAAFQLRDDVRELVRTTPGVAQDDLDVKLQEAWRRSPFQELNRVAQGRMPFVNQIFDLSALPPSAQTTASSPPTNPADIDFGGFDDCGVPLDFQCTPATTALASSFETFHLHEHTPGNARAKEMWEMLAKMPFGHRMWLMTAWSDNAAATTCIADLGLDYIEAVLRGARMYDALDNVGARLAKTYATSNALLDAGTWQPGRDPLYARISEFRTQSRGAAPRQAATVRAMLAFVAALDGRALISAADSNQMLALLRPLRWATGTNRDQVPALDFNGRPRKDRHGAPLYVDGVGSFILRAFRRCIVDSTIGLDVEDPTLPFDDAASKLGIADDTLSDLGLVSITPTFGPLIHWGVAFLGDEAGDNFNAAAKRYAQAIGEIVRLWIATPVP